MRLYERALTPHRPDIKALGLFDTVSSVIEHGKVWPQLRTHPFTRKNPSVEHVRHAVAIDERRTMFNPVLWEPGGSFTGPPFMKRDPVPQDLKEVWFSGVHGDVGGGYEEEKSAQAKIPLIWMIREMEEIGLKVYEPTVKKIVLGEDPEHPNYVKPGVGQKTQQIHDLGLAPCGICSAQDSGDVAPRRRSAGAIYIPRVDLRAIPESAERSMSRCSNA